jgi:predicted GNAT family acetyltransferase
MKLMVRFDSKDGTCRLTRDGKQIGETLFMEDRTQITITDVNVDEKFQMRGYGRIMLKVVMRYAQEKKKPIYLYSLEDVVPFYEKLGFCRIKKWTGACEIFIKNLNPEKPEEKQIDDADMIWIPKGKKKATVYI